MTEPTAELTEAIYSDDYYDVIVEYNFHRKSDEKKYRGCLSQYIDYRYAVMHLPRDNNPELSNSAYGYGNIPRCLGTMDLAVVESTGSVYLQTQTSLSLTGQGVLVGLVDTGIDYTNPLFVTTAGNSRIYSIWDQTIRDGTAPEGFAYGSEYTKEQINLALQSENPLEFVSSMDEHGHGTQLAALAAGNLSEDNRFSGIAPGSELVVVKLKEAKPHLKAFYAIPESAAAYQTNDLMLGISYLVEVAKNLHRPMVICIGLGTSTGGLGIRDMLTQYLETVGVNDGFCIVTAIGNEGLTGHTFIGRVDPQLGSELVEINVGDDAGFTLELWGKAPNIYSAGIISPIGEYIQRLPVRQPQTNYYRLLLEDTRVRVDAQLSERVTGHQVIVMTFERPTPGIWQIEVFKNSFDAGSSFMMKLPIQNFLSTGTYFMRPTPDMSQVNPAMVTSAISVAAYNYRNGSIYPQSSWGLLNDLIVKPDLAAPGFNILVPDLDHGFTTASGSSLAAASVAGGAALILEWAIVRGNVASTNSLGIKNFFIRGAVRDNPNLTYPNKIWGYGKMDLYQSYERLLRL